ncbi:MAG: glycoside hydrolase family 2 TIM barrel-domain containing protein [Eubacteriales bacterium]|nr:glycoside hydrolase family 2 TIM barrel-domain containing protein [Eubacteriales bacterium]
MQEYELSNWEIAGYYPYVPQLGMEEPRLGRSITGWMPAKVPGSVHADLWRAGWIEDPYFGMNSLTCEWVENKWWAYRTAFDLPQSGAEDGGQGFIVRRWLCADGLDYKCRISLNGQLLALHEGSFTPVRLEITKALQPRDNQLLIVFESAPDEESQAGHASHTRTQKSRFSYKWDFSTRMVPVGIWDRIWIEETGEGCIGPVWLIPEEKEGQGKLTLRAECFFPKTAPADCELELAVRQNGAVLTQKRERFALQNGPLQAQMEVWLSEIELWQPNGLGDQPLYDVELRLFSEGRLSHRWNSRTGFRRLRWIANEGAGEDALPYCLEVNGRRVYLKGVNLTPFDLLIGTVSEERYRQYLNQIRKANINLVRVNGVGLIEKEIFYELCDEYGILVWQEFIQTSSSMDRVPPSHPHYLKLLEETSKAAIQKKRNHVCLACYCGGNELTDAPHKTATFANPNIRFLQRLVEQYDTGRMMFPASASGPKEFLEFGGQGKSHDVHGPWNYMGPSEHYRLFNDSDSLLHGELGAEGMACTDSLRRFLPEKDLKVVSMEENLTWRHHGDWWDTWKRDVELFGPMEELERFVRAGQFIQAEAIRYSLESNRRRKYRNSGSLMWAYNEPFPNVSNTCLVDYYGVPKMSYYALRDAYSDFHMSLRYDGLIWEKGGTFRAQAFFHNSLSACSARYEICLFRLDGTRLWENAGELWVPENAAVPVCSLEVPVTEDFPEVFLVRLSAHGDGREDVNEYLFSTQRRQPFGSLPGFGEKNSLTWSREQNSLPGQNGQQNSSWNVRNTGAFIGLFVFPQLSGQNEFLFSPQAYKCLLPGEERRFEVVSRAGSQAPERTWERLRFETIF